MPFQLCRHLAIFAPLFTNIFCSVFFYAFSSVFSAFLFTNLFGFSSLAQESTTRSTVDAASPSPLDDKAARNEVDSGGGAVGNFGLSAFALTAVPRGMVNKGEASVFTYFYPSFNYKFSSTQRFAIRPVFLIDSYGRTSDRKTLPNQARTGDLRLVYSDYEMARLGDFTTLGGSTYWDYPTSEASLQKKIYSKFSGWYRVTQVLSPRLSLIYNLKPELIVNSRSSTKNGRFENNNRLGEWDHYFELMYDINRVFAPVASVGYRHEFYQADPGGDRARLNEDYFKSGFGSWIHVGRRVRFLALVQNEFNLRARKGIGYYRDENEETDFVLLSFFTIK